MLPSARPFCILALDDDPAMQALFAIAFRYVPVQLIAAENSKDAEYAILNNTPDVLLVDYHFNGESGLETAERILQNAGKRIPILLVTAETGAILREYLASDRCLGYLPKPIRLSSFAADVLSHVQILLEETSGSLIQRSDRAQADDLATAFLKNALTTIDGLRSRTDAGLLQDDSLASAAHRWIGASGIGSLPDVEDDARQLERLARTNNPENIPKIRQGLQAITNKFNGALCLAN